MSELPDCLQSGDVARLIPVGAAGQRERAACSVLLAALRVVQPLAREFFGHMEWRAGTWAQVQGYTEPVFKIQPEGLSCRPDGLIVLNSGRREWRFIVETKIGTARIDTEQLAEYYRLARANEVDAIITVSNELNADPAHLPYVLPREARNATVYHWSWSYLVMVAELLLEQVADFDHEQDYILREIIRYFDHESAGVYCPTQMCSDWPSVVEQIQVGSRISTSDDAISRVVGCRHQVLAAVCINRTRRLKSQVTIRLSRSHWDQQVRLDDDVSEFVTDHALRTQFEFDTASLPIDVIADASRRNILCRLTLNARSDRQRYGAQVRWLLNQLPEETTTPVTVNVLWERGVRSSALLSNLRNDLNAARVDSSSGPRSFEIVTVMDLGGRFAGPRTFAPGLEEAVSDFHENVARHVRPWQPAPDAEAEPTDQSIRDASDVPERRVIRRGEIDGRIFSIFNDGSIEVETSSGIQRFQNYVQLQAAASNGRPGSVA